MALARSRRWGAGHLVGAWVIYWVALTLVVLGRPAVHAWRLTHDAARHGSISVRLTNDVLAVTMVDNGATIWAASARLVTLALWLAGPPLVLFLLWLRTRPPPAEAAASVTGREHGRTQIAKPVAAQVGPDYLVPSIGDDVSLSAGSPVTRAVGRPER